MKPTLATFPVLAVRESYNNETRLEQLLEIERQWLKAAEWKEAFEAALRQLVKNDTSGMIIRTPDGAYVKVSALLGDTE